MRLLNRTITDRRRAHTNRGGQHPLDDRKSNLTPLHLKILQWVEGRRPGDSRPKVDDMSAFAIDTAVAELVLMDLVKAVSIPQSRYDRAHWEPTGLTGAGWRTLVRYRRAKPRPITHSWWRLKIWG
jgi:hypothetical protein